MPQPLVALFAVLLASVGAFGALGLVFRLRFLTGVLATGVTAPGDVGAGRVATVGDVEAGERTIRAPLTGSKCVGYALRREVKHRSAHNLFAWLVPEWRQKEIYCEFAPMSLTDDGDRVRVEFVADGRSTVAPNEAGSDLRIGAVSEAEYAGDEAAPPAVRERLGTVSDGDESVAEVGVDAGPHRYTEWRVEPGDRYYALGHGDRAGPEPVVRTSVERDALVDVEATRMSRLLGHLVIRLLTAGLLATVGFGGAFLFWSAA